MYNWSVMLALLHTRSPFLCQGSFPGNLQLVLVLRPTTLLQRTLSDILFKFNKDEFKMKVPVRALWVSCAKTHSCLFHEWLVFSSQIGKKWRRNIVAQRCWCLSLSGDYAELYNWAALLYWSHPTDPGARGNTGVLPWEVDLSPHSMCCSVLSIDHKTFLENLFLHACKQGVKWVLAEGRTLIFNAAVQIRGGII